MPECKKRPPPPGQPAELPGDGAQDVSQGLAAELRASLLIIEQKLDALAASSSPTALVPKTPKSNLKSLRTGSSLPSCVSVKSREPPTPDSRLPGMLSAESFTDEVEVIPFEACEAWTPSGQTKAKVPEDDVAADSVVPPFSQISSGPRSKINLEGLGAKPNQSVLVRMGLAKLIPSVFKDATPSKAEAYVHHMYFQLCVSFVILLHAMLTGYNAHNLLMTQAYGMEYALWVDTCEVGFSMFFLIELLIRIAAERLRFLIGPEWKWNLFDTLLVVISLADILMGSGVMSSVSVGRIMRLMRFFRLMRISRVMRHLQSLRMVLFAIIDSVVNLFWCFVFMNFFMYVFAVFLCYSVADRIQDLRGEKLDPVLMKYWGGITRSMLTLFSAITGGADWEQLLDPLQKVDWIYEPIFVLYIFIMSIGIMNVVVGAFVATTQSIADKDREVLIKSEIGRFQVYAERIKTFFKDADTDKSGKLSWDEFQGYLQDPRVKAFFQVLELDVGQAHILFDLLDTDDSDQVTVDEFLDGCMRLKGSARSTDLHWLVLKCEKAFLRMDEYQNAVSQMFESLETQFRLQLGHGMSNGGVVVQPLAT